MQALEDEGSVPAGVGDSRGRGARWQPPRSSWCQNPVSSEPGSEGDTPDPGVRAAPGARRPSLPPSLPSLIPSLTRPCGPVSAAGSDTALGAGAGVVPGRPWKRRPAGTTSGQAAFSLAVHTGSGRRPPLIGWLFGRRRNATSWRSAGRTGSGRTERFRCVW